MYRFTEIATFYVERSSLLFLIKRCVKSNSAIILLQNPDGFDSYFKF